MVIWMSFLETSKSCVLGRLCSDEANSIAGMERSVLWSCQKTCSPETGEVPNTKARGVAMLARVVCASGGLIPARQLPSAAAKWVCSLQKEHTDWRQQIRSLLRLVKIFRYMLAFGSEG